MTIPHRYRVRRLLSLVISAALFLPPAVLAQQNDWAKKFDAAWKAAESAEKAKDWKRAAGFYREVTLLIPHESTTKVALARCVARQGEKDEPLRLLEDAVELGWNQPKTLRDEPAFERLRVDPRYHQLYDRIAEIEKESIVVYLPPKLDKAKPVPLIVAFHGRSENPHAFLPTWKEAANSLGAVVVAPRGMHRISDNLLNVWEGPDATRDRDTARIDFSGCKKLTEKAIRLAKEKASIDDRKIILAGYSQGGVVALRLLCDAPKQYAGAFAQATVYKPLGVEAWRVARSGRSGRVYLLAGELDSLRPRAEQAYEELKSAGWSVQLEIVPGCGHEPPANNSERQIEAIRHILGVPHP